MSDRAIISACAAIEQLASAIRDGWVSDQTFLEAWGWNCPPVTRHDLYNQLKSLADRLRELSPEMVDADLANFLSNVPSRMSAFQSNTLQYFYNGNIAGAYPVYTALLDWLRTGLAPYLPPVIDWKDVEDQKLMPRALLRRLRSVDTQISTVEARAGSLNEKVAIILDAHAAAESLPTDLASLSEARSAVERTQLDAVAASAKVSDIATATAESLSLIKQSEKEARQLVQNCEDAYSAATTKGLGEVFARRAAGLTRSMWVWVIGLLLALAIGAYLGAARVEMLRALLVNNSPRPSVVWTNIVLALFSIGAPVWFAWVSTKQIGQRFRLSEDYAFKASVAQAYEGYRREAARIDPLFASRLFDLALSRLEEAPLRFVENETHGSPLNELFTRRLLGRAQAEPDTRHVVSNGEAA